MSEEIQEKRCPQCGERKALSEFYRNRTTADGHQAYCKPCWNLRAGASRLRHLDARRAKARETAAKTRAAHPDLVRDRQRSWYERNGQAYHEQWRAEHPESVRENLRRMVERREEDPIHAAHQGNTYRARREGATDNHTEAEWRALCAAYANRCAGCGEERPLEHDHVIPLALGGTDRIDNIQPLCHGCNTRKGRRTIDYRHK